MSRTITVVIPGHPLLSPPTSLCRRGGCWPGDAVTRSTILLPYHTIAVPLAGEGHGLATPRIGVNGRPIILTSRSFLEAVLDKSGERGIEPTLFVVTEHYNRKPWYSSNLGGLKPRERSWSVALRPSYELKPVANFPIFHNNSSAIHILTFAMSSIYLHWRNTL